LNFKDKLKFLRKDLKLEKATKNDKLSGAGTLLLGMGIGLRTKTYR